MSTSDQWLEAANYQDRQLLGLIDVQTAINDLRERFQHDEEILDRLDKFQASVNLRKEQIREIKSQMARQP